MLEFLPSTRIEAPRPHLRDHGLRVKGLGFRMNLINPGVLSFRACGSVIVSERKISQPPRTAILTLRLKITHKHFRTFRVSGFEGFRALGFRV